MQRNINKTVTSCKTTQLLMKEDRQRTYVTLRRLRVTTAAVEKQ